MHIIFYDSDLTEDGKESPLETLTLDDIKRLWASGMSICIALADQVSIYRGNEGIDLKHRQAKTNIVYKVCNES